MLESPHTAAYAISSMYFLHVSEVTDNRGGSLATDSDRPKREIAAPAVADDLWRWQHVTRNLMAISEGANIFWNFL